RTPEERPGAEPRVWLITASSRRALYGGVRDGAQIPAAALLRLFSLLGGRLPSPLLFLYSVCLAACDV
ncbi:MAG: hypothetical protein ACPL3C_12520, partial [Pyrobaculum sp.]